MEKKIDTHCWIWFVVVPAGLLLWVGFQINYEKDVIQNAVTDSNWRHLNALEE